MADALVVYLARYFSRSDHTFVISACKLDDVAQVLGAPPSQLVPWARALNAWI